jgi:hypothetical protein
MNSKKRTGWLVAAALAGPVVMGGTVIWQPALGPVVAAAACGPVGMAVYAAHEIYQFAASRRAADDARKALESKAQASSTTLPVLRPQ